MLLNSSRIFPLLTLAGAAALLAVLGCARPPQVDFSADSVSQPAALVLSGPELPAPPAAASPAAPNIKSRPRFTDLPAPPALCEVHPLKEAEPEPPRFQLLSAAALEAALEQIGVPYRRGGTGPGGFDCSGLVRFAFAQVGVELPHGAASQMKVVDPVDLKELQPGDLLFFRTRGQRIDHVGIYLEGREFVHSPSPGKRVSIANLNDAYWKKRLVGAGRINENL
ncbi:C40 family peptidase [Geoalkalibacter sp.]|uniref:C40 family peptidase n=1 Tax=Geoalkalibacter sp. TaxID=3041440 RepID=UPI00272E33C1|nr:C40 family peptidase [Geoalkalibacter sp.]